MPKLKGTQSTGPLRTKREGASNIYPSGSGRRASITIAALTTLAGATYTIADADALLTDVICVSPNSTPEAGVNISYAWVSANGTISVRVTNASGGTLTGGALVLNYFICR